MGVSRSDEDWAPAWLTTTRSLSRLKYTNAQFQHFKHLSGGELHSQAEAKTPACHSASSDGYQWQHIC